MSAHELITKLVRAALRYEELTPLEGCDWLEIQNICARHRVGPLVCSLDEATFPPPFAEWLQGGRMAAARRSIVIRSALDRVSERFAELGIQALLIKGLALQDWLYDRRCRVTGDLDILVDRADRNVAVEGLHSLGYVAQTGNSADGDSGGGAWRNIEGSEVDLHTSLIEPYFCATPQFADLWTGRMQLETLSLPTLASPMHLALLLLHGLKHQWCRLAWLVDVALLVQKMTDESWEMFHDIVRRLNAQRMAHIGLRLCRDVLDPPDVPWARILSNSAGVEGALSSVYFKRLYQQMHNTRRAKTVNAALHLCCMTSGRQRARYAAARMLHALHGSLSSRR